jgi:hypothetical protein
VEVDRIELAKQELRQKYDKMTMETRIEDQVTVAVDGICTLCIGELLSMG